MGFKWTLDSYMDHTEDFNRASILGENRREQAFVDVGAHTGMWTVQASPLYGEVIAIEPSKFALKRLKRNIRLNKQSNVVVIPKAVSNRVGSEAFYEWPTGHMGDSLLKDPVTYTADYGNPTLEKRIEIVDTISLDSIRYKYPPRVIKLDVEGAEDRALVGALHTIIRYRPILIIEIHRPENEERIRKLLPHYNWESRVRPMVSDYGKSEFEQIHLLGKPS